ncbi:MAG TPA: pitrilysin family protein [Blastocatellia bacterium]|nr:pitrilysin family protein [Blastocatellia bacterium]HMV86859.1 pitrilysin family protein [Blastocatellia bacterium]HMY76346.1 pitrilysin family protein [Blastocatellia bacterium]HMZ18825.1 pitrilysin family protein [Blastocatellia bacterium]HNG29867.1 pitrilysin family protein [Blastocatellia bacterium]
MTYKSLFTAVRVLTVFLLLAALSHNSVGVSAKPEWQKMTLKNGMEVIVVENRSVPLVTVEMGVKNGAYTEPPEYNGLSHLYEHMFFKSNERSRAEGYNDRAAELGMLSNATTREEVVNYYTTTVNYGLREAMVLMRDAIRYPLFDKQELDQEIVVVLDELNQHLSNPFNYLFDATNKRLWYKYPSRKRPGGDPETVSKATPEMMRVIQHKYYVPNNSALVVAGDVNAKEVFKLAEDIFGDWPRGEDPFVKDPIPRHPALPKDDVVIVNQPVNSATIQISWQGPSTDLDAPATYAADVFSYIVNQPNSQFARSLVDTGLITSGGVNYYTQKNVGPISITAQTPPEKLKEALKAISAEVAKFDAADYFTDEELASAKTLLEVNEMYDREKTSDYAHTISFWWASSGLDYYAGYVENLGKMTREQLRDYVRKYIKNKPRVVTVMVSEADQKRIGLTDQDLLFRVDAVGAASTNKPADKKDSTTKPQPKTGVKTAPARKPAGKPKTK